MNRYKFSKISTEGYAISIDNGVEIKAHGVLPGEYASGMLMHRKAKYILHPEVIENPSQYRIEPKDESFLSTSPWQITDYEWQTDQKQVILRELFAGRELNEYLAANQTWGYRTKVEFSFCGIVGSLSLAFFVRGKKMRKIRVNNFSLVSEKINRVAKDILGWINENQIEEVGLKSLILRESITEDRVIGALLFRHKEKIPESCEKLKKIKGLDGLVVAYSNPRSPAANIDEEFFRFGRLELMEQIGSIKIRYPLEGFFQNNLELFPKVLARINELIYSNCIPGGAKKLHTVLELYCGVGTIGLALANCAKKILGVDISEQNISYAKKNISENEIFNYEAILSPSEKIDPVLFENIDLLILDPSRPGLHPKVIKRILEFRPRWIIYMSCNPHTQKADITALGNNYSIEFLGGYDFYPHTPHIETLALLKLNSD